MLPYQTLAYNIPGKTYKKDVQKQQIYFNVE